MVAGVWHSLTIGVGTDEHPLLKANADATSRLKQYLGDAVGWAKGGSTRFIGSSGRAGTPVPESNTATEAVGAVGAFATSNSPTRGPLEGNDVMVPAPCTRGDQVCREGIVHVEGGVRLTGDTTRGDQVCRDRLQAGLPPGASNVDAVANSFEPSDEVSTFSTSPSDACNGTRTCPRGGVRVLGVEIVVLAPP